MPTLMYMYMYLAEVGCEYENARTCGTSRLHEGRQLISVREMRNEGRGKQGGKGREG